MTTHYATTLELARFLNIEGTIPSRSAGATRSNENVGTITSGTTTYYLDHAYILDGSYTIYADSTELTENTDYTLDKDTGTITLINGADTTYDGQTLYAKYSFCLLQITDTQLAQIIVEAEKKIDRMTNNHWADGTQSTPDYIQVTNEKHDGKGKYDRTYYLNYFPLPDVSTTLTSDVSISDTTINVSSTDGFPSSGYINIGTDKISYTGKTATSFTGCSGIDSTHSSGDSVYPFVFEISTTSEGSDPTWEVLERDVDYDIDLKTGRVYVYNDYYMFDTPSYVTYPPRLVPNRFRASYIWGNSEIPDSIKQLTLMMAARDLIKSNAGRQLIDGRSIGNINDYNIFDEDVENLLNEYTNHKASNV